MEGKSEIRRLLESVPTLGNGKPLLPNPCQRPHAGDSLATARARLCDVPQISAHKRAADSFIIAALSATTNVTVQGFALFSV